MNCSLFVIKEFKNTMFVQVENLPSYNYNYSYNKFKLLLRYSYQNSKSTSNINSRPMLNWLQYSPRNQCLYHWKFDLIDVRQSSLHFHLLVTLQFPQPASKIRPIGVSHEITRLVSLCSLLAVKWISCETRHSNRQLARLQATIFWKWTIWCMYYKAMNTTYANQQHFMSTSIFPVEKKVEKKVGKKVEKKVGKKNQAREKSSNPRKKNWAREKIEGENKNQAWILHGTNRAPYIPSIQLPLCDYNLKEFSNSCVNRNG